MSRTKAFFALCGLATIHSVKAIGFKSFERLDTTGFEIIADGEKKELRIKTILMSPHLLTLWEGRLLL